MATLPNEKSRPLPRFAIYKNISNNKKRAAEAMELSSFLLGIDQELEINDVEYGDDPPDFIFTIGSDRIGVELTTINPAIFGEGGHRKKKEFRDWRVEIDAKPQPEHIFNWGTFTLRESLDSLKQQFQSKSAKAKPWETKFQKRWLILHSDEGGPFGDLVATKVSPSPQADPQKLTDHHAKVLFEVCGILAQPSPFDYTFLFSGCIYVAFAHNGQNPYRLRLPRWDVIARGARVDDSHLEWKNTLRHHTRRTASNTSDDINVSYTQALFDD